ncbi:MAG: outer membrane lipoprotein-sorting protein [Bacteroidales bacterium]|jgi:outer membrane lipoprotein-sorting protein
MMKTNILILAVIISISIAMVGNSSVAQELSAKEIVDRANQLANGETSFGNLKMTIVRPNWSREVEMKAWSIRTEYSMIYITAPARDKGQVFLKRQNEMWNYMPSIDRMIKIPPSMMGQSWMGSDFTNDDLVRMNSIVEDFEHKITATESLDGYECWKIELIPKYDAAVVWGKIYLWISKKEFYQLKGEYFDEDGGLVNTMIASDIKKMGDRFLPGKMVMIPADKPKNQTILETIDMDFDIPLEEGFFSQQNMKNIR